MAQKNNATFWVLVASFIAGMVISMSFARKKGSALRSQLKRTHAKSGNIASILLLKEEYMAMLDEVGASIDDLWHTEEIQTALHRMAELTKEPLPRIDG